MTAVRRNLTICDFCGSKAEQVGPIQPVGNGALVACSGCSTGMAAGAARHALTADRKVLLFMLNNGGDFWRLQAHAWLAADVANSDRLMDAFGDVYRRYEGELVQSQQGQSSYARGPKGFPDDANARHGEPVHRCAHCGAASVLHWHPARPSVAVCSRSECGDALTARFETIAAEAA